MLDFYVDNEDFRATYRRMAGWMYDCGREVDTGHWQALENVPLTNTIELTDVAFQYLIPQHWNELAADVKPSTPWAEAQFLERVSGKPLNPGETFQLWPYYRGNVERHKEQGQFSHTYMERFWPRAAGYEPPIWDDVASGLWSGRKGIRYRYGDLHDVLNLLAKYPTTRQAYLPVWFPEDTGAHHGERVPCTLGYHLMMRDRQLHINYPIRSCDFIRHFADDVYLAARLCQWVLAMLQESGEERWQDVIPGRLSMYIFSLHVFAPERNVLKSIREGKR